MNQKRFKNMSILFLILGLFVCSYAKENGNRSLNKVDAEPSMYKFNVNNISTFIYADGRADVDGGNSGFEFPKGSNAFSFYESGFNWGGRLNGGEIRFGGSTFPSGLVTGKIGTDPEASRMYRVRPDWASGSMLAEINDQEKDGDEAAIREQYRLDWMEWPWQDAPYLDADGVAGYNPDPDGNGVYDLGEDIPGFPGAAQTIFFIANAADGDKSRQFYGSPPQLIEMHCTVWGYASVGPLGNMIFKKYKLFNKGVEDYTDFYVAAWCDPDLGNAGDDFVGCDTLLSLGYVYNANPTDTQYGDTPPAGGHDFFQGPIVPATEADTALVNGEKVPGWRNLGMSAFYYFVNENNTPYSDPDLDNYNTGTLYFYNLLQGRIPSTGEFFPIPPEIGGGVTNYPLSGDPVNQTGYIDGMIKPAKDRRYGMSSGPFTLVAGSDQEIVLCQLVARGADNRNSVQLLKTFDAVAQDAYNSNFVLPSAPTPPYATYSVFDGEIMLYWDSNPAIANATESHSLKGYDFQGYNVYQLPTASSTFENAVKIATFDIVDGIKTIVDNDVDPVSGVTVSKVVQRGNDTGIQRYFRITRDYINNTDLFNGTRYFFAVTSYAYSADPFAVPNNLENTLTAMTIVPQSVSPGVTLESEFGDGVAASHTSGKSNGSVTVTVSDPSAVTGNSYKVTFDTVEGDHGEETVWNLTNTTTGSVLLANQHNQAGDADYFSVEGLMVVVAGPDPGVGDWDIPSGTRRFTWAGGADAFGFEGFNGAITGLAQPGTYWGSGYAYPATSLKKVNLVLAKVDDGVVDGHYDVNFRPTLDLTDPNVSYGYRYMRGGATPANANFAPYILDPNAGSYGFQEFAKNVPLAAYDVEDPNNPRRLVVGFLENNAANGLVDGIYWPGDYGVYDNIAGTGPREWLFIFDADYSETINSEYSINMLDAEAWPIMYWTSFARRGAVPFSESETGEDIFQIIPNYPNSPTDVFTFTAPAVGFDSELAKQDIAEDVNVFPNPYYGANPQELNKYQRFVTFSHLPEKATIRIFNLAGQIVTTIEKNGGDQFQRWDLLNSKQLPVASGVYIAYIDMPDIGTTKVLKLAVIQEQQILDRF